MIGWLMAGSTGASNALLTQRVTLKTAAAPAVNHSLSPDPPTTPPPTQSQTNSTRTPVRIHTLCAPHLLKPKQRVLWEGAVNVPADHLINVLLTHAAWSVERAG